MDSGWKDASSGSGSGSRICIPFYPKVFRIFYTTSLLVRWLAVLGSVFKPFCWRPVGGWAAWNWVLYATS